MIRFLPLLLLPAILIGAPDDEEAEPKRDDSANDLRLYDISTLHISEGQADHSMYSRLYPYIQPESADTDVALEADHGNAVDLMADLIASVYGEEFEYEGRLFEVNPSGTLVVRGPEGLHERVERLIEFFEAVVNAQAELTVDVIRLPAGAHAGLSSAVVSLEDARALIADARANREYARYVLNLRSDRDAVLDISQAVPVTLDYDVEIAQGATIQDPIVANVSFGTRMTVRAAPVAQGLVLATMWKRGEWDGELGRKELNLSSLLNTEGGRPFYANDDSAVNEIVLQNSSVSFTTLLPPDKALVLRTGADLEQAGFDELVILRHTGGSLPRQLELELDKSGSKLIVADLAGLAPPRVQGKGTILHEGWVPRTLARFVYSSGPALDAQIVDGGVAFVHALLESNVEYLSLGRVRNWIFAYPFGEYVEQQQDKIQADQRRVQERLAALGPEPKLLDVSIKVQRVDSKSEPVSVRLPVVAGTSCCLAIGVEGIEVRDYDVEVAQFAAVADPVTFNVIDGLVLWMKPMITRGGTVLLDVRGGVSLLEQDATFQLAKPGRGPTMRQVDQSVHGQVLVNDRVMLSAGVNGAWTHTFGNEASGLQLSITITPK